MRRNNQLITEYLLNKSPKIKEQLIIENGGLVKEIIRRKFNYPEQFDDLYQEGLIALSNCIDKYDTKFKTTLVTFAYVAIKNRLINYCIKNNKKVPTQPLESHVDYLMSLKAPESISGEEIASLCRLADNNERENIGRSVKNDQLTQSQQKSFRKIKLKFKEAVNQKY